MSEPVRRYRAFISYSRKDRRYAQRLHRALETYRVPLGVEAHGIEPRSRRLGRFFRDDDEMGAASDLGATLKGALADAENLIVVCSPAAARSRWVNEEVAYFRNLARPDRVFAVLVGRKPHSRSGGDRVEECFPPALTSDDKASEPFALDWRTESFARVRARLAAGLIGVPFDALWKRDRRRAKAQGLRLLAIGAAMVLLITSMVGVVVVDQVRRVSTERSARLATAAAEAAADGRIGRALRLAVLAAHRGVLEVPSNTADPILAHVAGLSLSTVDVEGHTGRVLGLARSLDGSRILSWGMDGAVRLRDFATGAEIFAWNLGGACDFAVNCVRATFSSDGSQVLAWWRRGGVVEVFDASSGASIAQRRFGDSEPSDLFSATFASDNSSVLAWGTGGTIWIWTPATEEMVEAKLPFVRGATFSPDGTGVLSWSLDGSVAHSDARTGATISSQRHGVEPAKGDGYTAAIGAAFSRDGSKILSWGDDGSVLVWSPNTGQIIAHHDHGKCRRIRDYCMGAVLSADGRNVLSWGDDGVVRLWNATTGATVAQHSHAAEADGAILSPDELAVLSWSDDGVISVWRTSDGRELGRQNHGTCSSPNCLRAQFSPDGSYVVSWGQDGTVRIWSAADGSEGGRQSHGFVDGATFVEGNSRVLSWGLDGLVRLWDVEGTRTIGLHRFDECGFGTNCVDASLSGKYLLARGREREARIWNVSNQNVRSIYSHGRSEIGNLAAGAIISKDGARVFSWGYDGTRRVWDSDSGQEISRFDGEKRTMSAAFTADASRVLTWGWDGVARVFETATGREIATKLHDQNCTIYGCVKAAFSPDDRTIVSWGGLTGLRIWDAETGTEVGRLETVLSGAKFIGGRRLVTWDGVLGLVTVWDLETGRKLNSYRHHQVDGAASTDAGERIVSWSADGSAMVWDIAQSRLVANVPHDGRLSGAAFSPDGSSFLTWGYDGSAHVWRTVGGAEISRMVHGGVVWGAAFSPGGARALSWGNDGSARVWDVSTGNEIARQDHKGSTGGAMFSPDGQAVLSWGTGTARLWDATTGIEILRQDHGRLASGAAFSRDGSRILSWGDDGNVRVWDTKFALLRGRDLVEAVCMERLVDSKARKVGDVDVREFPTLRSDLGLDVCKPLDALEELRSALVRYLT